MNDSIRESLSYFGLYWKMLRVKKSIVPESVSFGQDKDQYFLYYEPEHTVSDMFLETREENKGLDKFFSWIEIV